MHPKGEREEKTGAQCILKRPPAAYQPIAASLGAGPGEPDSAPTIRLSKAVVPKLRPALDTARLHIWPGPLNNTRDALGFFSQSGHANPKLAPVK